MYAVLEYRLSGPNELRRPWWPTPLVWSYVAGYNRATPCPVLVPYVGAELGPQTFQLTLDGAASPPPPTRVPGRTAAGAPGPGTAGAGPAAAAGAPGAPDAPRLPLCPADLPARWVLDPPWNATRVPTSAEFEQHGPRFQPLGCRAHTRALPPDPGRGRGGLARLVLAGDSNMRETYMEMTKLYPDHAAWLRSPPARPVP